MKPGILAIALMAASLLAAAPARATPRYIVYYNADASPASDLVGLPYTHVILSFLTLGDSGPALELSVDPRMQAPLAEVDRLRADGKAVLVSFGGGDMKAETWMLARGRESELAAALAAFVRTHRLDGIDLDFEISEALHSPPDSSSFDGVAFLVSLTQALRSALPEGALLTHAPQAPYLDPAWQGGPYRQVLEQAGDAIDWITVQYYNNPDFELPIATHLVGAVVDPFPASYTAIAALKGWSSDKTLVGLPIYRADASNGHQPPEVVRQQIVEPLVARFGAGFGGLTGWQFSTHTADHSYWNRTLAPALAPASR